MSAHEDVRNLLHRYCELVDAGDLEALGELFADAVLTDPDGNEIVRGREGAVALYRDTLRLYDGSPRTRHLTSNAIIEVDEDAGTATSRSVYVVFQATDDLPLQAIVSGRYEDRFEQTDGTWRFRERRFFVDLVGEVSRHLRYELP